MKKTFYSVIRILFFLFVSQQSGFSQEMHSSNSAPIYPGGKKALGDFISKNLKYPDEARKIRLSGIVEVKFMINTEGKIENIEVMKGISKECDAEAVRVTGLISGWKPAFRQENPVNSFIYLPIEFKGDKKTEPTEIRGRVVEKITGLPLSGIYVIIKGTNIGSVSLPDGSYRLEVPSEAKALECFGVGYSRKEVEINFHSTINIELDQEYMVIDFQSTDN
ncbi:MAG TPA: TonB family protein [Bacteroidales bacterium]|nr:TonB family protein [Bacteroidales bacterium]